MSQPQNLGAEDLQHPTSSAQDESTTAPVLATATSAQDEAIAAQAQHASAVSAAQDGATTGSVRGTSGTTSAYDESAASAPERVVLAAVTDPTSALESTEATMAVTNAARADQLGTTAIAAVVGAARAEVPGMFAAVERPRLQAVDGGSARSAVPATARYAGGLTEGALALRLQAITRLGVGSAPRHLSSITSAPQADAAAAEPAHLDPTVESDAADAKPAEADAAGADAAGTTKARKLSVVSDSASAAATPDAAPGQPDGARAPLTTTTPRAVPVDATAANAGAASAATAASVPTAKGRAAKVGGSPVGTAQTSAVPVGVPEARAWGGRLAQAVSEVLAGDRPISQLVRFTDDSVFMELNRRVRLLGLNSTAVSRGAREKSTVRSVRVFMPEPWIAEVAAHVRHGDRSRAIAFRLEIRRNRWVCTALEIG
ncbi:Rv3235 family protein [Kribbella sp. NPDC054772]